ncbi:MAG: hypothetical protein GEU73_05995 [Chloroflexi bacterium]|nr:hypothetical protein [Chloroflexota bacterium]
MNEDERTTALFGPRALKAVGSPEWCWQTIDGLKSYYGYLDRDWERVERLLGELEAARAWEVVPPEGPYGSLDRMLQAELGTDERTFRSRVVTAREHAERATPAAAHRRPTKQEQANKGSVRTFIKRGETSDYLAARIARDRPDILEAMKAGQFPSVHAAARAAGVLGPRISVAPTVTGFARAIARSLSPADRRVLIEQLIAQGCGDGGAPGGSSAPARRPGVA